MYSNIKQIKTYFGTEMSFLTELTNFLNILKENRIKYNTEFNFLDIEAELNVTNVMAIG